MFAKAESVSDSKTFRQALGQFPTGVCVLTSVVEGVPLGMTVSSFNSLSLSPPLVLFSIDGRAGSLRCWAKAEGYALNVLAESQREMSERFAKARSDKWEGTSYGNGLFGAPVLPGIAALFECAAESTREAGDHVLFIGAVKRFRVFSDRRPLVFHGGQYGRLHCSRSWSKDPEHPGNVLRVRSGGTGARRRRGGAAAGAEEQGSCSPASG